MFHIALLEPEIPPNTGNIMRICANTGFALHLIEPFGFSLSEKQLKRAGMDYIQKVPYKTYPDLEQFRTTVDSNRLFCCSTKATTCYADVRYAKGDVFLFGPETRGLPQSLLAQTPKDRLITIPMVQSGRSLNLANAVSIILYEAWRQLGFGSIK